VGPAAAGIGTNFEAAEPSRPSNTEQAPPSVTHPVEAAAKEPEKVGQPLTPVASMSAKGITLQTEDKRFIFNVRFPFMFDAKATIDNDQPLGGDAFFPRFFGPILSPTIYGVVTGKLIVGFQNRAVTVVTAWLDVAAHPLFHLRLGKLLYPISLERQTLPLRTVMMEHGIASALLPISDFGAQVWGASENRTFEYQLTVANGAPANQHYEVDVDDKKDAIGRVYLRPFAATRIPALAGLGLGFGASYGTHQGNPSNPATGTAVTLGGRTFFATRVNAADSTATTIADGRIYRLVPQANYLAGPLSVYAEYVHLSEELKVGGARQRLEHASFHAVIAFVLTGENAVLLDIVSPSKPFDIAEGNLGAFELTGRYESFEVDANTFPLFANPANAARRATAIGGGFNWVPTAIIRIAVNYEHATFQSALGAPELAPEHVAALRVQALF
jgi:phosphate-selective porin OprO/OprP